MTTDAITVTPIIYTVTVVCPLCHQAMTFREDSVNTCPHCGKSFIVRSVTATTPPPWAGGPVMETK